VENLNTTKRHASELYLVPKTFHDHINNLRTIMRHLSSITPRTMSVSVLVFVFLALFLEFGCRLCSELFSPLSGEVRLTFGFCC
jgi:hypothetical protein